jgi:isopenicillin N synthase-like dioxygenase
MAPCEPAYFKDNSISSPDLAIPLLDLSRFEAGAVDRAEFLDQLRSAAHDVGFFYLTGHGIESRLLEALLDSSRRFFALPQTEKQSIEMVNSPHFRGYTKVAWERTRGAADWREQIDIGAERAALVASPGAPAWTRLQGPNQWPTSLPELRVVVLEWQAAATRVLFRLMRALSLALVRTRADLWPRSAHARQTHSLSGARCNHGRSGRRGAQGCRTAFLVAAR